MVQLNFVELETELVLAVERVLLILSLNFDGAIGSKCHGVASPFPTSLNISCNS